VRPHLSYTIWFTQRIGSTLLCAALESTGVAGRPGEWLEATDLSALYARHEAHTPDELLRRIWAAASTPNGVLGIKHGLREPWFTSVLDVLGQLDGHDGTRLGVWQNAFPNLRHIFMTRRDKVRLAVSWWKAIQSEEWHRQHGIPPSGIDAADRYVFDAIDHLVAETVIREAAIQEFFTESGIVPLTIVYEDFVERYEQTVADVLAWLGVPATVPVPPPYDRLADPISEEWVQRYRQETQTRWTAPRW